MLKPVRPGPGIVALALLGLVTVLPPLAVALYGLSERWDRSLWPEGATLAWLQQVLCDERVLSAAARTTALTLAQAVLTCTLGALATVSAYLYAPRLSALLNLLAQVPFAIPAVVVATTALEWFVGHWGGWLDARVLYVLLLVPLHFPLVHRGLAAALQRLDAQVLLEAGRTLGASEWRTIRGVLLPLLRPALVAAFLLALSAGALEFAIANLLLGGTHELLQPLMNSLRASSGHHAAALILLSLSLIGLLTAVVQRLTRP
jgi:putative spermidine/putrescine transport system permease protein